MKEVSRKIKKREEAPNCKHSSVQKIINGCLKNSEKEITMCKESKWNMRQLLREMARGHVACSARAGTCAC